MGETGSDPIEAEHGGGSTEGQRYLLEEARTPFTRVPYCNHRKVPLIGAHREVLVSTGDIPQADHQVVGQDFFVPLEACEVRAASTLIRLRPEGIDVRADVGDNPVDVAGSIVSEAETVELMPETL